MKKEEEWEFQGKTYKSKNLFPDQKAIQTPIKLHLNEVSYWEMIAKIAEQTNSQIKIDQGMISFCSENDDEYIIGDSYVAAGPFLVVLKQDERNHAVLELICFANDIGEFNYLELNTVTFTCDGIIKKAPGTISEWNTSSGMFFRWISDEPVEIKQGTTVSGEICSEIIAQRYYIDYLRANSKLDSRGLSVSVESEPLNPSDRKHTENAAEWNWWTIHVLLNDISDSGLTKQEYGFVKDCWSRQLYGEVLDKDERKKYEKLALKSPRLRFNVYDFGIASIWQSSETPGYEQYCHKCAMNTHETVFEKVKCKFDKQKSLDYSCKDGLEIEVKIRNMKDKQDAWPVGLLAHKYLLQTTRFEIKE